MDFLFNLSPFVLALGGLFTLLTFLSPKAALFVIIPTTALAPEVQLGSVALRPDDLMMSILVISWALRRLGGGRRGTPLDAPLWAYFGIGLVATLWGSQVLGTADLTSLNQYSASGLHVVKRLQFVLYFFVLTDAIRSIADVRRLLYVFMASLTALSVYSLGRFYETGRLALAPVGAAIHEPGLAAMLNVALALGILVASKRPATSFISGSLVMGSLWVLPFSLGRNFIVATLAMLGLVGLSRKRALLLLLPLAWLVAPVVLPEYVLARALSIQWAFTERPPGPIPGAGLYVPERLAPGLSYSAQVLNTSPLLGWGLGSVPLGSTDNEYAGQFATTGFLGFLVFVWMIVRIQRTTREAYRVARDRDSPALPFIAGLQHCLLGYALYSIFSPSISAARAGAFFFTIIGLVAVLHRELVPVADTRGVPATAQSQNTSSGRTEYPAAGWAP